jgi:hypothetical protein
MASIQRRLNSTGRKRITRDRIVIELSPPLDTIAFPSATATISLAGLDLDQKASVILEAYFRSSDLPLNFHPAAIRVSGDVTPLGAV